MAYESYPKNGKTGSRHVFSGEKHMDGWSQPEGRERREYNKSGQRIPYGTKAQTSEKFKTGSESPGNTSKREYPKKAHHGAKFGTVKKQGHM